MERRYRNRSVDNLIEEARKCPQFKDEAVHSDEQILDIIEELKVRNIIKSVYDIYDEETYTLHDSVTDLHEIMADMSPITRFIINQLIDVVGTFWSIILGAQKTKTDQMMKIIKLFLDRNLYGIQNRTVVPVLFTRNDQELTGQTVLRFLGTFARTHNIRVHLCSSAKIVVPDDISDVIVCNPSADTIASAIEVLPFYPNKPTPIVISLNNKTQGSKVVKGVYKTIVDLRHNAAVAGRIIQYSTFIDEADEVYRTLRALIQPYLCDINEGACIPKDNNYSTYFVTATHEGLLELPEFQLANQTVIDLSDFVKEHYIDINHPDCIQPVKNLRQRTGESNGDFVLRLATDYKSTFHTPIPCPDGIVRMPIILATADYKNADQVALGEKLSGEGYTSIVLNQNGFRLIFTDGRPAIAMNKRNSPELKGKQMNERLFWITQKYPEIRETPLVLIGHRKLGRAITYHYAPPVPTEHGMLVTDEIFGYQKNVSTAVQTSGRINGVIAHRPEYAGFIRTWYDQRTFEIVLHQVRVVLNIEENSYTPHNIITLHEDAVATVPAEVKVSGSRDIREIGPFNTKKECFDSLSLLLGTPKKTDAFKRSAETENHEVGTRLKKRHGVGVESLTAEQRVVLDNTGAGISYNSIGSGIVSKGLRTDQNFHVIPVYANSQTPPTDVKYMAQYEEPVRDSLGFVLFKDDSVFLETSVFTVKSLEYSKDGVPNKVVLSDNRTVNAWDLIKQLGS
jgi:hypothetical protein